MEVYTTEEEQIDAVKKWWRENGTAVVGGVVIGLAALFGWQGWEKHRDAQAEQASTIYSQIMVAANTGDLSNAEGAVDDLLGEFPGTPYAALAALVSAKTAVQGGEYDLAMSRLQWIIEHAKQQNLIIIAKLRLARLHIVNQRLDEAELLLNESYPADYAGLLQELKGDLYAASGEFTAARDAYDKALASDVLPENRQVIEIKRDALAETATSGS